jgi:predicted ferric reductase
LSGPLFLIVILHWLTFRSPIVLDSAAGIWLAVSSAAGVIGAVYKLCLYPLVSPHAQYRVVAASPGPAGLQLELAPVARAIAFAPGQFGFLSMKEEGLREPHPFTIASASSEKGHVEFAIRDLGDYTHELIARAAPGMHAEIYMPFGRFERVSKSRREVWIAGGVGISPFISWLQDETAAQFEIVTLFYFFTPGREFPAADTLKELAIQRGVEFVAISSGPADPLFAVRFSEIARSTSPEDIDISFCGPMGLLREVQRLARETRIPRARIRYEYFDFR